MYIDTIDQMYAKAGYQSRVHLLRLKKTLTLAAPELIPHLFWERITSICNYYFYDNREIRNIFKKIAEWEMDKQRISI